MNFQTYVQTVLLRARPLPEHLQVKHACLGMVTELGELGDAFKKPFVYGTNVDSVNVMEECGDFLWYFVLAMDTLGVHMKVLDNAEIVKPDERDGDLTGVRATFALAYLVGNMAAEHDQSPEALRAMAADLATGTLSLVTALLHRYGRYSLAECLAKNDAKLELRTGKSFNPEAILNRDTAAERASLEQGREFS